MSDITYEPTREHWTPYEPWMRDVLAGDARVSYLLKFTSAAEKREPWGRVEKGSPLEEAPSDYDLRVHPDDVPERPAEEDPDEALAKVACSAFWGSPTEPSSNNADWMNVARAAREHIEAEADDADFSAASLHFARATRAEAERDWWRDAARRHVAERGEAEEELVELVDERDEWKARYKALRADVERVRRNRTTLTDVLMCIADVLDRDDERGQGDRRANAIERGCGEDFRRRFVDPAPDTVTLRREDAEGLLHCWSEEPDFGDADRAITARVRAALGWGDDSE